MFGVLYAVSPEIFPAKDRGTGNGLTATAARLFAILVRERLFHASLPVALGSGIPFLGAPGFPTAYLMTSHFSVANYCIVRGSYDCSPRICQWRVDPVCWGVGFAVAF